MNNRTQWSLDLEKKYGITRRHTHQGVYAIRAKDTDEVLYVGSTSNLYHRCSQYFSKPKQNEEHLGHLWCWEHIGEWYFDVLLIRDNIGRKELRAYEKEFQLNYRPKLCKCYGDDGLSGENHPMYGEHCSEETRARIGAANRGKNSPRSKPVCCEELKIVFSSVGEAVRWLRENGWPKATQGHISQCCHAKQKTAYGYHWRFEWQEGSVIQWCRR